MRQTVTRRSTAAKSTATFVTKSTGYLPAAEAGDFDFTEAFTLEGWYNPANTNTHYLASKYSFSNNQRQYSLTWSASSQAFFLNVSSNGEFGAEFVQFKLDRQIELNKWRHFAATYDANTNEARFYIDGQLQPSTTSIAGNPQVPMASGTAAFCLGALENNGNLSNRFAGKMRDWRAWNKARTAEEINANKYELDSDVSGLVGRWVVT